MEFRYPFLDYSDLVLENTLCKHADTIVHPVSERQYISRFIALIVVFIDGLPNIVCWICVSNVLKSKVFTC